MAEDMKENLETEQDEDQIKNKRRKKSFLKKMAGAFKVMSGVLTLGILPALIKRKKAKQAQRSTQCQSMIDAYEAQAISEEEPKVEVVSKDEIASEKGSEEHSTESVESKEHQSRENSSEKESEEEMERE